MSIYDFMTDPNRDYFIQKGHEQLVGWKGRILGVTMYLVFYLMIPVNILLMIAASIFSGKIVKVSFKELEQASINSSLYRLGVASHVEDQKKRKKE